MTTKPTDALYLAELRRLAEAVKHLKWSYTGPPHACGDYATAARPQVMLALLDRLEAAEAHSSAPAVAIRFKADYTGSYERGWVEVIGEVVSIPSAPDHRFALQNSLERVGEYSVAHIETGFSCGRGKTPDEAIAQATENFSKVSKESLLLKLMRAKNLTRVNGDRIEQGARIKPPHTQALAEDPADVQAMRERIKELEARTVEQDAAAGDAALEDAALHFEQIPSIGIRVAEELRSLKCNPKP